MGNRLKRHIFFILFACNLFVYGAFARKNIPSAEVAADNADTTNVANDTIQTDSIRSSSALDAPISYRSNDSIVLFANGTGILYGNGDINYKDIELSADLIEMDMDSSLVFAQGVQDSLGNLQGTPRFKDGGEEYEAKSIKYNIKTKKGFITDTYTQQGEGVVKGEKIKKREDDIIFLKDGFYTTCSDHEHPHFGIHLTKATMKQHKYIVSGPAYVVFEDVPLPLAIPFGYFPFTKSYSSGILIPSFGDERTRGFYLKEGGYYWAISDYIDLALTGDIYTKGSWALHSSSNYVKRYKFTGSFSANYQVNILGDRAEKNIPGGEYSKNKDFSINWTHTQSDKANQYRRFSAKVNFATSSYERNNVDSYYNPSRLSQNTKSSSISLSQKIPNSPFSIDGSFSINQRTKDSTISLSLPDLNLSMSRVYPLKRKSAVGKERWYEKISVAYTGRLQNSITTKEDLIFKTPLSKWSNGMKHTIPIQASYTLFKYINITPTFNYTSRWNFSKVEKHWENGHEVADTTSTFKRVYDYNFSISAQTKIYAFFKPVVGKNVEMIRWVLTPMVGYSMHPDFGKERFGYWKHYNREVQTADGLQYEKVYYTPYNRMFDVPSQGRAGNINFSLANNVEMKVRSAKDTITGNKKISIIDNFSISGAYNLIADSMNWSNFNANLRLKFTKNFGLTLSGSFDPYEYRLNSFGNPVRVNKLRWNHGRAPQLISTSTSFGYSFSNSTFKKKEKQNDDMNESEEENAIDPYEYSSKESLEKLDKAKKKTDENGYAKFSLPWNLRFDYSLAYGRKDFNKEKMQYNLRLTHNISFSGNISLTSKWQLSASLSYDITNKEITYTNFNITRDLHCWTMTASFVPIGLYRSYNVTIAVNSSMLRDLKYQQRGNSYDSVW